jgi:amidase
MPELHELGALELVRLVRARDISRRQVLESHLDRIDAVNDLVNAVVERVDREAALSAADAADRDHEARSALPLDGVPVSIKDHFDVEGMLHTEGVARFSERRSPGNSAVVQRWLDAGGFVVGKCNQPDFQIRWNTVNDLYGATRNPRDTSLTAGGSSGGDAAAVASGMAALGLGADYGGSIRVPASFCGVFGLRPSAGRVPEFQVLDPEKGGVTLDLMNSPGPFARTLDDLWAAFVVLAGPDPRDPSSLPVAPPEPVPSRQGNTVLRMARETGAVVEPEIERELDRVCAALEAAGYRVVEGGIPNAARAPELWAELVGNELLHSALPDWHGLIAESNLQHIETMFGLFDFGDSLSAWSRSIVERRQTAQATAQLMEEHPLIVAPVAGMATPALDFDQYLDLEATRDLFDHMRDVVWVNLLSLPSLALPNGIQLVARRFHEAEAVAAAAAIVEALEPVAIAEPRSAEAPTPERGEDHE